MISKFDIQKLQDLPIEQVAGALGFSVSHHKALCPFHDDSNPSLTFSVRKNRYRCFVCDAHGGVIDLVMRYLNKNFLDACRWLADDNRVTIVPQPSSLLPPPEKPFDASRYERFFERPFLNAEARKFLFTERRLDARVIRWCRLTSWKDKQGIPWLQIPYYDRNGKLIGIQNRNLAYGSKGSSASDELPHPSARPNGTLSSERTLNPQPRFRFPSGSACSIYNLPVLNLLRPGETLFIAEGCSDCWSLLSAGHKAIAIPSATLLTKKDKELLNSLISPPSARPAGALATEGTQEPSSLHLHFAMFPDQDEPGERLFLQLREVLPSLVRHQLPSGCKDFSDYYLLKR